MSAKRKVHSPEFKSKVALEACKGLTPVHQLASEHQIHPAQVSQWKKQLLNGAKSLFSPLHKASAQADASRESQLYEEIGRLKVELDWLKKKTGLLR